MENRMERNCKKKEKIECVRQEKIDTLYQISFTGTMQRLPHFLPLQTISKVWRKIMHLSWKGEIFVLARGDVQLSPSRA